jgi:GTP cyclohydrolase III
MEFITLDTKFDDTIAINAFNITSVQVVQGTILIYLGGDNPIPTKFTTIESAVDYIQRTSNISLTQGE